MYFLVILTMILCCVFTVYGYMIRTKSLVSTDTVILLDSLNIDKNPTQHESHLISYKCEYFQLNILKINPCSSSKSHKGVSIKNQILKLKNQFSALRRFLLV